MAIRITRKKTVSISRIVAKIVGVVISLYAGGIVMTVIGNVINGTASGFYGGLTLIGWTVETVTNATSVSSCSLNDGGGQTIANCVTSTTGAGILAVIGVIGIASVVMEFVNISF